MGLTNNLGKLSNMITSTGSAVGIGTSSPSYTLDVTGTGTFRAANGVNIIGPTGNPAYLTTDQSVNNGGKRWRIGHTGAASGWSSFDIYNQTDNILGMTITSTGVVGIGTSSPTVLGTGYATLDVRGSSGGGINMGNGTYSGYIYCDTEFRLQSSNSAITFLPSGSEKMRITSAGNLGILTSTPYAPLQVNGNIHRAWTSAGTTGSPASQEGFVYSEQSNANALAGMWFENNFQSGSAVSVVFKYRSNGASVTEGMRLTAGGLLSIGTSNPYFNTPGLLVGGSGSSYFGVWQEYSGSSVGLEMTNNVGTLKIQFFGSSGNYYFAGSNISDIRAKSNIQEITEGLSKISKLKPSTFTYDKNPDIVKGGFIAQEVLEVIPEFVTIPEDENEMMGVDYFGILALAVKSIQELEARLKTLENK